MFGKICGVFCMLVVMMSAGSALAAEQRIGDSGLPLPRFVTVNTEKANVRTGPGIKYAVEWVFVRSGMPVEIVDEYDSWRKIRDVDGTEGWVYGAMLSGKRGLIVEKDMAMLRREPSEQATVLAKAEKGTMGRLRRCTENWCEVEFGVYRGWMHRDQFWGTYPQEKIED